MKEETQSNPSGNITGTYRSIDGEETDPLSPVGTRGRLQKPCTESMELFQALICQGKEVGKRSKEETRTSKKRMRTTEEGLGEKAHGERRDERSTIQREDTKKRKGNDAV